MANAPNELTADQADAILFTRVLPAEPVLAALRREEEAGHD